MSKIIGRYQELKILEETYNSDEPQFLAIYGRRRVGKTYLISEFFKDKGVYFELTGTKDAKLHEQLFNFSVELSRVFYRGEKRPSPDNWTEALNQLRCEIEKIKSNEKIILFFDELPWLASRKSGFLQALEHFWNRYMSRNKNVIVIICGSAASWMIDNIIHNKGGLHGRVTKRIQLFPFSLSETEEFLKARNINLERKQLIEIYMAMGGVAQYLKYIERGSSATQTINDLCFVPNGPLFDEFEILYKSLFDNYEIHINIIKALSKSLSGLTKEELLDKVGLKSGGTSSKIIEELRRSGFIAYIPAFGKKKIGGKYRLIDEYSLFYLIWIAGVSKTILEGRDKDYWFKKRTTKAWTTWCGYVFENICLKHIAKIKETLGLSGISTKESGWSYVPSRSKEESGAQVDLVIDRADNCINLCELKYYNSEFVIDKEYAKKLEDKKRIFKEQTKTNNTLFTTMITTYGTKKNIYYNSVVDNQLTMDVLF
ncbi:ATP-binding protein [bacterium]|nr:ATP-binding protein [bacterium]